MMQKYPILKFILKHKQSNIAVFIILMIASVIISFFVFPKEYTSNVSVLPSAANSQGGIASKLGNLGKLAGINIGAAQGQTQDMLKGIIQSRLLLDRVLNTTFKFNHDAQELSMTLIDFFEVKGQSKREIHEKAIKKMIDEVISISIDKDNDILQLSVTTENPFLSALVADEMVKVLNDIVKTDVQKEYRQKLSYLNTRLAEIQDSMYIAEKSLKRFLETNTDATSPSFQIEQLRLKRTLEIQSELYIEFRKQLEIYIADNMINMADIKVLDNAEPPFRKSRPKRLLLLITFASLSFFFQVGANASVLIYKGLRKELAEVEI